MIVTTAANKKTLIITIIGSIKSLPCNNFKKKKLSRIQTKIAESAKLTPR